MDNSVKFQCAHCGGILIAEYGDEAVMCGHCEGACEVPAEFGPGVAIDDFLIENLLGSGGMGNVYIAYQFSLDRQVALKILHPQFLEDEKFQVDFINEARSVASLNHLNIIQAYKVGIENGVLFFAMELVEGLDLSSVLKREGSIIESYAIDIAIDTTNALGYAWNKSRLVHRDIKPENIMVASDGTCKVMDLGLSLRGGVETEEDEDTIAGTPQYISPEQVLGTEVDIRSDFYCLGATLFHLVTGRFVFEADSLAEMVHMHVDQKAPSLQELVPETTAMFNHIIGKLLEKKPEDRYQDSDSLIEDLEKAKKALTKAYNPKKSISVNTKAIPKSKFKKGSRQATDIKKATKKKKAPIAIIAAIIAVVIIVAGIALSSSSTPEETTAEVTPNKAAAQKEKEEPVKNLKELFENDKGFIHIPAIAFMEKKDGANSNATWRIEDKSIIAESTDPKPTANTGASASYKFTAKQNGLYYFWIGGILKPANSSVPIFIKINGKVAAAPFERLNDRLTSKWAWTKLTVKEHLIDGVNEVQLITKEPGVKILHSILTADKYFFPNTDRTPNIAVIEPVPPALFKKKNNKSNTVSNDSAIPGKTYKETNGLIQFKVNNFYDNFGKEGHAKWEIDGDKIISRSVPKPSKSTKSAIIKYSCESLQGGDYNLWMLIKNPSTKPIFSVRVNTKFYNRCYKGAAFSKDKMIWIKSTSKIQLKKGVNTISLHSKYNDVTIAKFILTKDDNYKVGDHPFKESSTIAKQ